MKKVLFIAAIASLSLASCKKDYTCECTGNFIGITYMVKTEAKSSKKGAEEWCKGMQSATTTEDGQPSATLPMTCAIK